MLADSHAHLDFGDFDSDRGQVITRARKAGISLIVNPGIDVPSSERVIDLSRQYDIVYAAVGIHPNSTAGASPGDMTEIARLATREKVVAIGETGLDFYRASSPRETQLEFFKAHLALAREMNLPIIIHFRNVGADDIALAGKNVFEGIRGVFHCFGGDAAFAREVLDLGFYLGFDGPLTYPKSDRVEIARMVPLERILIETDAPFLTPQPHRGKRNEPAYLLDIAEKLSEIKGCARDEVFAATGENARKLFGI